MVELVAISKKIVEMIEIGGLPIIDYVQATNVEKLLSIQFLYL